jgi:hypothetical protein
MSADTKSSGGHRPPLQKLPSDQIPGESSVSALPFLAAKPILEGRASARPGRAEARPSDRELAETLNMRIEIHLQL